MRIQQILPYILLFSVGLVSCSSEEGNSTANRAAYSGPGKATIDAAAQWQGEAPIDPRDVSEIDAAVTALGMLPSERAQEAYNWTLPMINGDSLSLSDFSGRVVIIDFWDTWCPPCRRGIPELVELQTEYGPRGLTIVGMAFGRDGVQAVAEFAEQYSINYPVVMANAMVSRRFGNIRSIPTAFVIDREGRMRSMHVGYTQKELFRREIEALLPPAEAMAARL